MAWIPLKDGWLDESSEGPYTETLQTKGDWSILRLYSTDRVSNDYLLRNTKTGLRHPFKSIEEAKQFVKEFK